MVLTIVLPTPPVSPAYSPVSPVYCFGHAQACMFAPISPVANPRGLTVDVSSPVIDLTLEDLTTVDADPSVIDLTDVEILDIFSDDDSDDDDDGLSLTQMLNICEEDTRKRKRIDTPHPTAPTKSLTVDTERQERHERDEREAQRAYRARLAEKNARLEWNMATAQVTAHVGGNVTGRTRDREWNMAIRKLEDSGNVTGRTSKRQRIAKI